MRSTAPTAWHTGAVTEVFECRNRRRVTQKGKQNRSVGTGARVRPTKDDLLGDVPRCQQRIKVISFTKHAEELKDTCKPGFGNCQCLPEWLYMKRTDKTVENNHVHTHDIDLLDRYKRSDALMYYSKLKIEEGYSYSAVLRYVHERYGPVTQQAYHLSKADVGNVSRPWRLQNKDVELKTEVEEESYEQKRRRECLDAIESTTQGALAKALAEVCRQIPQAVDIAAPFMEFPERDGDAESPGIVEGNDLVVSPPGIPTKKMILSEGFQGANTTPTSAQPVSAPSGPDGGVSQASQSAHALTSSTGATQSPPGPSTQTSAPHPMLPPPPPTRPPIPAAAISTDPETTSQAFISESSRTSQFAVPYQASRRVLPPPVRTSTSAQLWPPASITQPLARRTGNVVQPLSGSASSPGPRPSWAVSTVPQKRPIDAVRGDRDRPSPDKRTLVEEISAQLRDELRGSSSVSSAP
ncbi:uncharacterized protein CLAFUR5_11881 [Fulvia fulva]|uniref:Uncharacterized protein n=1 Tax=Passalora fulva TaxID=5499 RepID=A0A9Q8PHT4_PASFU|nr:uncharacterized protein CLAFUR5_11881 [Fulvia fulva]KAK4627677.1 hypothetical protein CLAFUR0_05016 [Fulvia fulva]UJO22672.1 hypothetical protein CLAFUR5_11881 [Fulvia fulva]